MHPLKCHLLTAGAHLFSFSDFGRLEAGYTARTLLMNTNMCSESIIKVLLLLKASQKKNRLGWPEATVACVDMVMTAEADLKSHDAGTLTGVFRSKTRKTRESILFKGRQLYNLGRVQHRTTTRGEEVWEVTPLRRGALPYRLHEAEMRGDSGMHTLPWPCPCRYVFSAWNTRLNLGFPLILYSNVIICAPKISSLSLSCPSHSHCMSRNADLRIVSLTFVALRTELCEKSFRQVPPKEREGVQTSCCGNAGACVQASGSWLISFPTR
jgi:hypothetical protein